MQSSDQTVHNRLERFFGDWCKARRLHTSNDRRASDRPWLCTPPWVLSSLYRAALRPLRCPLLLARPCQRCAPWSGHLLCQPV